MSDASTAPAGDEKKWWYLAAKIFVTGFAIYFVLDLFSSKWYEAGTNFGNGTTNAFRPLPQAREGISMLVPLGVNVAIMIAAISLALSIGKDNKKVEALNKEIGELRAAAAKKAAAATPAAAAH